MDNFIAWCRKVIDYYHTHGTKILGSLLGVLGTTQACLAAISADPDFKLLITPTQFKWLSMVNVVLGIIVVRRGFTNTKTQGV